MAAFAAPMGLGLPSCRLATYSAAALSACLTVMACGDTADDLICALSTGIQLDIAAIDQIRPIATTTAIAIDVRISILSAPR